MLVCLAVGCSDDGVVAGDGTATASNTSGDDADSGIGDSSGISASTDPTVDPGDGSDGTSGDTSPGSSGVTAGDSGDGSDETTGADTGLEPGTLPEPVAKSGVVYVAHFLDNDLRWYRVDGETPTAGDSIDMGAVTHDMALDDVNDRLYVAQDVAGVVAIYGLGRPDGPADPVVAPTLLGTFDVPTAPRFVRVDPYHQRLYVVADDNEAGTGQMRLHTVDVSDPAAPALLSEIAIPSTTSLDVDGPRNLLALFHGLTDEIFAYDVSGDTPTEVAGSPIDLREPYPEENNTAFSARKLTFDPWHNRLYAARPQSAFSELIVMEYPEAIPGAGQAYDDVADFSLTAIADPFDLSVDIGDRQGILDAFTPMPSPLDMLVFMTASAWNGTQATATVVTFSGDDPLALEPGCGDHEDFGCFLRDYVGGNPVGFLRTDGAACRDWTHNVVVATGLGNPEDGPGQMQFYRNTDDGGTSPWLNDGNINLLTGALPVATACH